VAIKSKAQVGPYEKVGLDLSIDAISDLSGMWDLLLRLTRHRYKKVGDLWAGFMHNMKLHVGKGKLSQYEVNIAPKSDWTSRAGRQQWHCEIPVLFDA
jgi:hypothetical protein